MTQFGPLTIGVTGDVVTAVDIGAVELPGAYAATAASSSAFNQILEDLSGKRRTFDFPVQAEGSAFQREVWDAVSRIPFGHTATASQLAAAMGKPDSHRSVGAALARCPLAIVIPTHRVVGATWKPVVSDIAAGLRALERAQLEQQD